MDVASEKRSSSLIGLLRPVFAIWVTAIVCGLVAGSAHAAAPKLTFEVDPTSWTFSEKAKLQEWTNTNGTVQTTFAEVVGPPGESATVRIVKATTGNAGEYEAATHTMYLSALELGVLVHEENHATRGSRILSDRVWEEGLARAGEKEVMRLLASKGVTEAGYDTNHSYTYDVYYDNDNTPNVGVPGGYIYAEPALQLLRYEQAGYAFAKLLIEDPSFIKQFDSRIFLHANGDLSPIELAAIATDLQPVVETEPTERWIEAEHIFDADQGQGCYLYMRTGQYTVDLYCVSSSGEVSMVPEAKITLTISGPDAKVFKAKAITGSYGWVSFSPEVPSTTGRLKLVASANSPQGRVKETFYRQSGEEEGVFGVIVGADTGTVQFSSPSGQFASFAEPVTAGAFAAPALTSVRGQIVMAFSGERRTGTRVVDKDAAPYSVVIQAVKVKGKGKGT